VTINETVDGQSQVQQRDRKGTGMAVGPEGLSVGRVHHALWNERRSASTVNTIRASLARGRARTEEHATKAANPPFEVFPHPARATPELLDVGQWMAISGGAVSTGLGARTSMGVSMLLGFFNVRLGYWWHSGVDPRDRLGRTRRSRTQSALALVRGFIPVQMALLDEWMARFPGVAREEWNLSDGGHFENMGAYELLRRRLDLIIICDNEQDEAYEFAGLANLVRKARTDLGASITFLSQEQLDGEIGRGGGPPVSMPPAVGPLDALRRDTPAGLSRAHAALARIDYAPVSNTPSASMPKVGWLLYVKPTLVGDEPVDVINYHSTHPDFPHQSTGDQFFDEAQWESYRRLGEHLGERLFGAESSLGAWVERVAGARST
jgi:hypothetical protein